MKFETFHILFNFNFFRISFNITVLLFIIYYFNHILFHLNLNI